MCLETLGMRKKPPKPVKEKVQLAFGTRMRQLRADHDLTQEALAELADLHTNYVSSVERGERNVSLFNIIRIAHALGVQPALLLQPLESTADG